MSIYTSSRERAHKLEQQSKSLGIGSSGTSAAAQVRDSRRNTYLKDMAQQTTQTTPKTSGSGVKINPSGYVPVYGSGGQYTGAAGRIVKQPYVGMQTGTGSVTKTSQSRNTNSGSERKWYHTAADMANHGSGNVMSGVSGFLDGVANFLPQAEGWLMGEDPEATFTGQLLRPIKDSTGQFNDNMVKDRDAAAQRWRNDLADESKVVQMAGELVPAAIAAIPYLATAFLTQGGSVAAGTTTTSAAGAPVLAGAGNIGLKQMVADATKQMATNPLWEMRFVQSYGNTYNNAKAKGATELEAITTATMAGYTTATLEQAGGIEKILNTKNLLNRSGAGCLAQMMVPAGTEAAENIGQGAAEQIIHKGVYDKQMPLFSAKDTDAVISLPRMGMEAAEGVLFGGPFGIPVLVRNGINTGRLKINVLQQALEQPIVTTAHQKAKALTGQMETKLTELGMDTEDLYHITRAEQTEQINRVIDSVLTDKAVGELAAAMGGKGVTLHTPGEYGEKAIPYSERNIDIGERLNGFKERLLSNGDYISDQVGTYQPQDLAALTTETGVEYTLITIGGESHLIRGGECYTGISNELYRKLLDGQGTLDCHSHPFIGDLRPSKEDRELLGKLTWQEDSIIIEPTQKAARYNQYGVIETFDMGNQRDENYYDDMFEEKE